MKFSQDMDGVKTQLMRRKTFTKVPDVQSHKMIKLWTDFKIV